MTERLTISFTPAEGAVLRMLGMVERRGYALCGVNVTESGDGGVLVLDVKPRDAGRRINVVAQQLGRLVDVRSVSLGQPGSAE